MDYRTLGRTPLKVSSLCLGTMTWGEQNSEAEGHEQMDYALDQGINFFDAAELYPIPPKPATQGRTEEIIGSWLAKRKNRDKVILATKVIGRSESTWFRDGDVQGEVSRAQIIEAVDKSLKRLKTDYIDLYQIHWPDRAVSQFGANPVIYKQKHSREIPIEEQLEAMEDLVRQGKIRYLGVSNESSWGVMRFIGLAEQYGLPRVQSVQNAYNLLNRTFETSLAEVCTRENVGLLAYSALGQGYLTGKYEGGALPEGSRKKLFDRLQRYETPGAVPAIAAYLELAREVGLDPAQMAIQFAATRPFVTSTILGATTMDQLKTNIASLRLAWTAELEERINEVHLIHTNPCP